MKKIYDLISILSNTYPYLFWIGLTLLLLVISFLIIRILKYVESIDPLDSDINKAINENLASRKMPTIREKVGVDVDLISTHDLKEKTQLKSDNSSENSTLLNKEIMGELNALNDSDQIDIKITTDDVKARPFNNEILPDAKKEELIEASNMLFVNFSLELSESFENYPVLRIPCHNCVIRSHRYGNTKRRGFKEIDFQNSLQKYLNYYFEVSGNARLNTGNESRPYEPDIALISKRKEKNIRIDIEIDEPYAGITRQPTHCKGDDSLRDTYFVDRGWMVIRFSEFQVHTQEAGCLKYLCQIIKKIDPNFNFPTDLMNVPNLIIEKQWDILQAQKWAWENYRERYLNHEFGEIEEKTETKERDLNSQEIDEEKLVISSYIGVIDYGNNIGYNKTNEHPRDKRITFYPEKHIYTINNIPIPSASTLISRFFPEFNPYEKAKNLSPGNELFGLPIEEIVKIWKQRGIEAATLGTYLHQQIEKFLLNQLYEQPKEFSLFMNFISDHPDIVPYRSEWRIFDDKYGIAGTIDLICKSESGYDIYDWKRSKKVVNILYGNPITYNNYEGFGVGELSDINDTSYNRYCLQQSLYRFILESNYNLKINKMYLVVLHPNYTRYYKVETPYWKEEVEYMLKTL